jgi:hypothetical protein
VRQAAPGSPVGNRALTQGSLKCALHICRVSRQKNERKTSSFFKHTLHICPSRN